MLVLLTRSPSGQLKLTETLRMAEVLTCSIAVLAAVYLLRKDLAVTIAEEKQQPQ